MPINSAINPLLYTFTTTKYRAKVYKASLPLCVQTKSKDISASSNIRRQSPHSTAEGKYGGLVFRNYGSFV